MSGKFQSSADVPASRTLPTLTATTGPKLRQFCHKCRQVFQASDLIQNKYFAPYRGRRQERHQTFQHYENLGGIVQSASEGCNLCSFLRRSCVLHNLLQEGNETSSYDLNIRCPKEFPHLGTIYIVPHAQQHGQYNEFPVVWLVNSYKFSQDLGPREKPYSTLGSSSTNSLESFSRAKTWLQTCKEHHDMCSVSTTRPPSLRLLSVNVDDRQVSVRLCEAPFESKEEPYLALSHCWGGIVPLRLTIKTLPKFLEAIPVEDLPQTFWDAIVIVSRLGYRFIWIDSLCIIQDSKEDWDEQVAIMGDIYRNSVCSIAALSAENSYQGCFRRRDPVLSEICWIDGSGWYLSRLKQWAAEGIFGIIGPDSKGRMRPPLHKRAWVVQERALSPRTLYYSSEMIFWECIQSKASECNPLMENLWTEGKEAGEKWIPDQLETGTKSIYQCLLMHCGKEKYHDWKQYWRNLVEEYTTCELTKFNDKWPAIAGLAANVERLSRIVLLRGLWEDHLLEELLWATYRAGTKPKNRPAAISGRRSGRRRAKRRKRTYEKQLMPISEAEVEEHAPSWSWISMNNVAVHWHDVDYAGISFECNVSWIANVTPTATTTINVEAPLILLSEVYPCHYDEGARYDNRIHLTIQMGREPNMSGAHWIPDEDPTDPSEFWVLQIVSQSGTDAQGTMFCGIVVKEEPKSKSLWSRVGYFEAYWFRSDFRASAPPLWLGEKQQIKLI